MSEYLKFQITDSGPVSREIIKRGFFEFYAFAEYIRSLPYSRTSDPMDILTVLNENQGTCSGKHQLLATVAHECGRYKIKLMIGIYKMSEENTPGVGPILSQASVESIPEAHCYLSVNGSRFDFTGLKTGVSAPFDSLLSEHVILPFELAESKPRIHKRTIKAWAERHKLNFSQAWALREECIKALIANNQIQPTS